MRGKKKKWKQKLSKLLNHILCSFSYYLIKIELKKKAFLQLQYVVLLAVPLFRGHHRKGTCMED